MIKRYAKMIGDLFRLSRSRRMKEGGSNKGLDLPKHISKELAAIFRKEHPGFVYVSKTDEDGNVWTQAIPHPRVTPDSTKKVQ